MQLAVALLVSVALCKSRWGVEEEDGVAVLSEANFDDFVARHELVMVEFFAPWCGHCKALAPAFASLAERFEDERVGVIAAKLDASAAPELSRKLNIVGYPTLKLFKHGEPIDYKGPRETKDMFEWARARLATSAKMLAFGDIEKVEASRLAVLLLLPKDNADALRRYDAVAANYEKVPFYFTHDPRINERYEAEQPYLLVVFRDFDDGRKFLMNSEEISAENIRHFFEALRFPTVSDFEDESAERLFANMQPTVVIFADKKDSPAVRNFRYAAGKSDRDLVFVIAPISTGVGSRLAAFAGVTKRDEGAVFGLRFVQSELAKYRAAGNEEEQIFKFAADFKADKLERYYKSEDAPKGAPANPKIIVGKTFVKEVLESPANVLLYLHASWCEACKGFDPVFSALAARLGVKDKLEFAKMDGGYNEHPHAAINGAMKFPLVVLFKKGKEVGFESFKGQFNAESLEGFLKDQLGGLPAKPAGSSEL